MSKRDTSRTGNSVLTVNMRRAGVTKMPRKLPKALLKMAAASLPPDALVKMTAEETGGGIQPKTSSLQHSSW